MSCINISPIKGLILLPIGISSKFLYIPAGFSNAVNLVKMAFENFLKICLGGKVWFSTCSKKFSGDLYDSSIIKLIVNSHRYLGTSFLHQKKPYENHFLNFLIFFLDWRLNLNVFLQFF